MGIGDTYEGAVVVLQTQEAEEPASVDQDHLFSMMDTMLMHKNPDELLQYLADRHFMIDRNNYQSTNVEKSYEAWKYKAHTAILTKFKQENVPDKYFLEFARIVSGRDGTWVIPK